MIRLRYQNQLLIDDVFLYFGVICLCAAMGLLVEFSNDIFTDEALRMNPLKIDLTSNYSSQLHRFQKMQNAYLVFTYTTIFSVKLSFLFFFRTLVRQARQMMIYWWTVLFTMIVAWILCIIVGTCITCPYYDIRCSTI